MLRHSKALKSRRSYPRQNLRSEKIGTPSHHNILAHPEVDETEDHVTQTKECDPTDTCGKDNSQTEPIGPVENCMTQVVQIGSAELKKIM